MAEPARDTPAVRLDNYLWHVRLARTRSAAAAVAGAGHVRIDGRVVARAHAPVRVGNVLTVPAHGRVWVIRVEALPLRRGSAPEAQACYTDLVPVQPRSERGRAGGSGPIC